MKLIVLFAIIFCQTLTSCLCNIAFEYNELTLPPDTLIKSKTLSDRDTTQKHLVMNIEWMAKTMLDQNIETVFENNLLEYYHIKDTIICYEDVCWKGVVISTKNEDLYLLESNWVDSSHIKRIKVLSCMITTQNGIHINSRFGDLEQEIDNNNLNSQPDGELGLIDKHDNRIIYMMDISNYKDLFYGVKSTENIPNNLTVKGIIIVSHK